MTQAQTLDLQTMNLLTENHKNIYSQLLTETGENCVASRVAKILSEHPNLI